MLQRVVKVGGGGWCNRSRFTGNKTDFLPLTKLTDMAKLKVHLFFASPRNNFAKTRLTMEIPIREEKLAISHFTRTKYSLPRSS